MRTAAHSVRAAALVVLLAACGAEDGTPPRAAPAAEPAPAKPSEATPSDNGSPQPVPRNVYYGDTHVHTGWSADAGMDGAILTPDDAYRFALGMEVTSNTGQKAKLERPYDWFMVTDHSDGMGVINEIVAGNREMMANPTLRRWRDALQQGGEAAAAAKSELIVMQSEGRLPPLVMDPKWMQSAWEKTVDAAEQYYRPGEFSTFVAFEWTVNAGGGDNLHRNVIFRDGADRTRGILPLTTFETQDPEKLWAWMANYEEKTGGRVLAIPHNGNLSNGRMFEEQRFDGSPMTPGWARMRARYEPLFEVSQIKGQSESHPSLSPNDDFAAWDLWDKGNLILKPKPDGALRTEYWREALKSGLRLEDQLGANPFHYGANAATDTHTGLSTTEEDDFFGKFKTLEPRPGRWDFPLLEGPTDRILGWRQAASGVMGVWAAENTREAIWDAMERRETFATTGPRMKVVFFGGFDFDEADLEGDLVATGRTRGVPMGGSLTRGDGGDDGDPPPTFLVAALKDPQGANLDRVQIVKGWVDAEGRTRERIFDVAWSGDRAPGEDGKLPPVGSTVDLDSAEYSNTIGAPELAAVFRDPDFDPARKAFYYVRALEIPTPRWTLYDEVRYGVEMSEEVPRTHQERAFSSPIWYAP